MNYQISLPSFWVLIFTLLPTISHADQLCTEWTAKITSLQGVVEVKHSNTLQWTRADLNGTLCSGDSLRTGSRSRADLLIQHETSMALDARSTVRFSVQRKTEDILSRMLKLFSGQAYFRSRRSRELEVETPFVNAMHEGTEFLVKVTDHNAQVVVFDGSVLASNEQGSIAVKHGESALVEANMAPVLGPRIELRDAVQWSLYYPPVMDYTALSARTDAADLQPAIKRFQQNDLAGAFALLDQIDPQTTNVDYHSVYASFLLIVGRVDEAENHLNTAQQGTEDDNATVLSLRSIIDLARNNQQAALQLAQQASLANPQAAAPNIALSYAYQATFAIDKALEYARLAIKTDTNNALAWARVAELELAHGDLAAATRAANTAQQLNPYLAKTNTVLGFTHLAALNLDAAEQRFRTAIARDPADPLSLLGLGLAKIRQGHLKSGTRDMETAANLDPANALIRSYLGKAYHEQRRGEIATTEYSIAKQLDPNDPTPWFYDAIYKQTVNRPVAALQDMQTAIELNDNRAVYRSRLLLDADLATRGASLARIFDDIQFDQVAILNATQSLDTDPTNYSAHRFLSDSYVAKPRHEIARASEILQSQLLQPININPVQPRLSVTDLNISSGVGPAESSFMEYTPMFETNGVQLTATGLFGSNSTLADEAVISGLYNQFSYSLGQLHYETDGFRPNNDLEHDLYNVFGQVEIMPGLNIQGEFRHRKTQNGDLALTGDPDVFQENNRRELKQNTYRLGARLSTSINSDFIVSFIHANRDEKQSAKFPLSNFSVGNFSNTKGYQVEGQHLYHRKNFNLIVGGGAYLFDVALKEDLDFGGFCPPVPPFFGVCNSSEKFSRDQYFGYLYSQIAFPTDFKWTLGFSYDALSDEQGRDSYDVNEFSPKAGLRWKISNNITFRAAAFQTVKSSIIVNQLLQPTQIAGFNQFFDYLNGTRSRQYGFGVDVKVLDNLYGGAEMVQRYLKVPRFNINSDRFFAQSRREEIYRGYMNWLPADNWAVSAEYRFEKFNQEDPKRLKTSYLPFSLKYFNPCGFFSEFGVTYIRQSMVSDAGFTNDFTLFDAAIGYRLPKRFGMISLEAKNILDKKFKFRDRNFQMNEVRAPDILPEQTLFARITFNL